mmetsp:Transcript_103811/g.289139  ORF Transcript_103811/g.289139 Transcript_103811/m.289139 type:complete len:183 (+) Transcript_103811:2377-2925(+)
MPALPLAISSSWEPRSTIVPCLNTITTSESLTVLRRCAIVRDMPASVITSSSVRCISRSVSLSRAEVASSKSRSLGRRSKARAIHTRCRSPPENARPLGPAKVSYRSGRLSTAVKLHFFPISSISFSEGLLPTGLAYSRFARRLVVKRTGSCSTSAMAPLNTWRGYLRMSTPFTRICPPQGS